MLGLKSLAKQACISPTAVTRRPLLSRTVLAPLGAALGKYQIASCSVGRRYASTQAEDESGHISAGPNEGIFFLESLQPETRLWELSGH